MEEDASRSSDPRGDKLAGQAREYHDNDGVKSINATNVALLRALGTDARSSVTSCEGDGDARDTTERWDAVRAEIMNCSVIIGLHPDQALDYIVDFALAAYVFSRRNIKSRLLLFGDTHRYDMMFTLLRIERSHLQLCHVARTARSSQSAALLMDESCEAMRS